MVFLVYFCPAHQSTCNDIRLPILFGLADGFSIHCVACRLVLLEETSKPILEIIGSKSFTCL